MTWFKVDDSFYDHPKVFDAPDCAVALWTRAGTWSARNLTEGFVPSGMPARLCDDPDTAVKELVRRGLWLRTTGGYRFHDWCTYQPTKESVEDIRSKRAAAGRLGGQARAAKQNASKALASASPVAKQNAAPTRPDPKEQSQNTSSPPATDDPNFTAFWEAYPRKVGKPQARKAWRAAIKRKADPGAIIAAAKAYRDDPTRRAEFTKHPGPWLNDDRYEPEQVTAPAAGGGWWNA
jgi:hypothetical protein